MAEHHPWFGGMTVRSVVKRGRGRPPPIVKLENPPRKEPAIEPVRQHVETGRGDHEPEPVDLLVGIDDAGDDPEADRAEYGQARPDDGKQHGHSFTPAGGRTAPRVPYPGLPSAGPRPPTLTRR